MFVLAPSVLLVTSFRH